MPTTLALVGRTNVGKSTLFNYLTQTKAALTADMPGLTRDRRYGSFQWEGQTYTLIDTGGLGNDEDGFASLIQTQVEHALEDANYIGFVVDAQCGLTPEDEQIARSLRNLSKPILCIINKVEGRVSQEAAILEFSSLGFNSLYAVSALQRKGFSQIITALNQKTQDRTLLSQEGLFDEIEETPIKIAIIGRPNAGKSTLVNRLLGEDRQIVSDTAGTTRDSIEINFHEDNQDYILVDTAGIRRLCNITSELEMATVDQSLASLQTSAVAVLIIDAALGLTDQELRLIQRIVDSKRALVILCNKWDQLNLEAKEIFQKECKRRLRFIPFVRIGFISGLYGTGVNKILTLVKEAYENATKKLSTSILTRLLQQAVTSHTPPRANHRSVKLRYAHPGGYNPPTIVIHGTNTKDLTSSYKRYLDNFYRTQLKIVGTPLKFQFIEKKSSR